MHGIYYVLFILQFLFFSSLFFSSLQTQSFQHSFQPLLPLGMNISNSIQTAYGQCPGGEYVNIDAVPKRSWVGNMMKTATYYSVLVQSLSVAVRYRRRWYQSTYREKEKKHIKAKKPPIRIKNHSKSRRNMARQFRRFLIFLGKFFVPRFFSCYFPVNYYCYLFVLDFPLPLCHFPQICLRSHPSSAAFWDSGSN